jgi:hypothetical protein
VHFATLHREVNLLLPFVPGNDADVGAEDVLQHQRMLMADRGGSGRAEDQFLAVLFEHLGEGGGQARCHPHSAE